MINRTPKEIEELRDLKSGAFAALHRDCLRKSIIYKKYPYLLSTCGDRKG